jgi:hypothetical protein
VLEHPRRAGWSGSRLSRLGFLRHRNVPKVSDPVEFSDPVWFADLLFCIR